MCIRDSPALIAAGATRNVVVTAAKAGLLTDTLTLSLTSKALTGTGLADGAATTQTVAVSGTAYDFAVASHAATLALGNLRVNTAQRTLAVTNALAANGTAAYQDTLDVTATSSNARLGVVSGATGIAATAAGDVTVKALTAGSLAGSLTLGLTSKAVAGSGLADAALANGVVAVTGAAYDLATASVASTLAILSLIHI